MLILPLAPINRGSGFAQANPVIKDAARSFTNGAFPVPDEIYNININLID